VKISELCQIARVSKESVRHYESLGLIRPSWGQAGSKSYRNYDDETVQRLAYIQVGKSIGFSLREMEPFLNAFMSDELSEVQQIELIQQKLDETNEIIRNAESVKRILLDKLLTYRVNRS
jgi:DNA-binding transcriptional MerR regulator